MTCDLCRLRVAIDTARENIEEERRFQLRLNGFTVPDPPPKDQSDEELNRAASRTMAMLFGGGRVADDDDD